MAGSPCLLAVPPIAGMLGQTYHCSDTFKQSWKSALSFVMSVFPFACINLAPTGWIFMEFDIGSFICQENPDLVKICQQYWPLYVKTYVRFILLTLT